MAYLEIIVGPMFSGKTKKLISTYNSLKNTESVIAINHSLDTRYGNNVICSHDKESIPSLMINNFFDSWFNEENENYEIIHKSDYILINEAQFFSQLYVTVKNMLENNKKVFIYGLDGDYLCKEFGEILKLIPLSSKIEKLSGICKMCGGNSIFTHRLTKDDSQVSVGNDNYIPVCRNCYMSLKVPMSEIR